MIIMIFSVFFYGMLMEIMQLFIFADRNGDVFDIIANTLGIFIALPVFALFRSVKIKKDETKENPKG